MIARSGDLGFPLKIKKRERRQEVCACKRLTERMFSSILSRRRTTPGGWRPTPVGQEAARRGTGDRIVHAGRGQRGQLPDHDQPGISTRAQCSRRRGVSHQRGAVLGKLPDKVGIRTDARPLFSSSHRLSVLFVTWTRSQAAPLSSSPPLLSPRIISSP